MMDFEVMPIRCTARVLLARRNVERAERGQPLLSQNQVARDTGIPLSVVNGLISGRTQRLDFKTLERMCRYFNVQPGELLVWEADVPEAPEAPIGGAL